MRFKMLMRVGAVAVPLMVGTMMWAPVLAAQSGSTSLAGTLPGTWQGEQTLQRGGQATTLQSTYVFKSEGGAITGVAVTTRSRSEIVNGQVDGDQVTFGLRDPFSNSAAAQPYRGTYANGTLTIARVVDPNAAARRGAGPNTAGRGRGRGAFVMPPLELHKVSADTVYHLPADLAHAPLPPVRPLAPNGLALTPPMGWNSWNHFKAKVDDHAIRQTADLLVSTGMRDAGYIYVNIDDTWEGTRDAQGNIQSNSKFPDMKALADYVHSKGLKLGIYSSPGPKTCAGYEGSYQHEAQDARTYAAWGIDYLKYDWCSARSVYGPDEMEAAYEKMALALRATGRPIVFSLCQYGDLDVWNWGAEIGGNLWRTTGDIQDNYASMSRNGFSQSAHAPYAGPGHWNDPDMLEIGNGGMTGDEYRTHMSLWSILAAPLLAGNDLSQMTPADLAILTNREVIAVDQDKLGKQGARVSQNGDLEVWTKPLAGGALAVGLFNRGPQAASMTVQWSGLGLKSNPKVRDLWAHRNVHAPGSYTVQVPSHGVVMLRAE
ncbi:MAG TPA: glycoside hydrolase family 27 protein [Terriglobales bacterium]